MKSSLTKFMLVLIAFLGIFGAGYGIYMSYMDYLKNKPETPPVQSEPTTPTTPSTPAEPSEPVVPTPPTEPTPPPAVEKYTLSFDVDGSIIYTIETSGYEILVFPTPTKAGHDFAGWYLDNTFGYKVNDNFFEYRSLTSNMTLYAKFNVKIATHHIYFNMDGINISSIVTDGNEILTFPTPSKTEHEFAGWYLEREYITLVTGNYFENITLTEDITLYAKFNSLIPTYLVNFDVDGTIISTITTKGNETLAFPTATKNKYILDGWYSESEHINLITEDYFEDKPLTEDITLYARFYNEDLEFELLTDNTYGVKGYNGTATEIVIPNYYLGVRVTEIMYRAFHSENKIVRVNISNSVTSIGSHAFCSCTSLTSIIIPNRVTFIGESAFYSCDSLTGIDIPNSVTSIGNSAFAYCRSLTSIIIPDNVTFIDNTFEHCSSLKSIVISNGVTSISRWAFRGCSSLERIIVKPGNTVFDSRNNCNAIIRTSNNTLIVGCKNTIIPNSVTSIGLESFSGCRSLTSIDIPNSVTSIGSYAFENCTSLTNIVIPNSVTSIEGSTFCGCTSLTNITIPNSVTYIKEYAFSGCDSLTSIIIPNSVTSIWITAFRDCKSLTSFNIPSSVTYIGRSMLEGCDSLTNITVESGNTVYDSRNNCNAIIRTADNTLIAGCKNTIIPDSVTSIGESAFNGCDSLTSIVIPNSITSIEKMTFYECNNLTDIYYTGNESEWNAIDKGEDYLGTSNPTIYYYSDTTPTTAGNYWHYDTDGITPVKW